MDENRHQLIKLNIIEAQEALLKLWNGDLHNTSEQFCNETGEDFEQCLVEFITENKCYLKHHMIKAIISRFNNDNQFYELAHMLISCVFNAPFNNLTDDQKYILKELCLHEAIWHNDMYLPVLLTSLNLPNNKQELINYINKMV